MPWDEQPEEVKNTFWREEDEWRTAYNTCAECGSDRLVLQNYDLMWHEGDLYCENGHLVRTFDGG